MKMKQFFKNYGFITSMLLGIGAGCVFGWLWPEYAANLSWLGQCNRIKALDLQLHMGLRQ